MYFGETGLHRYWSIVIEFCIATSFKSALSGLRQFLTTGSPLKMLFILPQKFFLFSRYLSFCLDVLVMYQNGLIKKIIFPSILRSKVNQTMKFNKLIECNMTNIFLEKSYTNCDGEN